MTPFIFRLPDIGEGVTEAEINVWHVKPGDVIAEDQSLVDVMTDKASVDMTAPIAGTVLAIHGAIGDMVPVGAALVEIQPADDTQMPQAAAIIAPVSPNVPLAENPAPAARSAPLVSKAEIPPVPASMPQRPIGPPVAPLASPATRQRAFELGIALQFVVGTGRGGLITDADLDAYLGQGQGRGQSSARAPRMGITDIKITGLRRKIAERMAEAMRRIPHFSYVEEFDLTALESLRSQLNVERTEARPKLTLLPFFMRAIVQLQRDFPSVNARYDDEAGVLQTHEAVHIGIATQTPAGLMVPVVRHAETLDLWDCARELARVSAAARDGSATREQLSGSTITLTSLGALGGIAATPIINAPEVAIIGPNKLVDRPMVVDGQVVIRKMMNLSSSFDHRIIDGHEAARFVQALKRLIEQPALLFVEAP